jgi:hypothetical protein
MFCWDTVKFAALDGEHIQILGVDLQHFHVFIIYVNVTPYHSTELI